MKAADYRDTQAAAMSEDELLSTVRVYGRQLALLVYHTHNSRRSEAGFPDVIIVGRRGVLWRELKRENGRVTGAQQAWLNRLTSAGQDAGLWRPSDLVSGRILREMRALVRSAVTRVSPYIDSHATSTRIVEDWRAQAACRGEDPEIFFADSKDAQSRVDTARAKTICRTCPSKDPCLAAVLTLRPAQDAHGIRGGLDAKERARLRRRNGATG